ncbi:calpain-2 catalytic subunit-like [Crassostrea virginica]
MERKELFKKVFPTTQKSQAILHFRFWYFGQWVDIYVDDALPVQEGCLLMTSHSAQSDREIGIRMAEKAYTKFTGSYTEVERKDFEDFFLGLTGGYAMKYELKIPTDDSEKVYFKFKDTLASGSFIFCAVKNSYRGYFFGKEESLTFSVIGTLPIYSATVGNALNISPLHIFARPVEEKRQSTNVQKAL